MIVNFLIQMLISFITWAVGFLPNFNGLPQGVTDGFTFLQPYFNLAYSIFPMGTVFQILLLMISIEIGVWSWDIFWWIYEKLPGKFT